MRDIRGYEVHEVETTSARSKLLGAAVVAFGIGALGVYAFASGDSATPASQQMASNQIRTTPEDYQSQQMPAPVTPTALDQTPLNPATPSKPQLGTSQQAAVQPKPTVAAPSALEGTPLDPKPKAVKEKPAKDDQQQAAVKSKAPSPTPDMTPPENAQPAQPTQPAATPDQPAPQEAPAPDTPQAQ